jgi:2-dehydro-3-deoxygluconokinase
VQVCCVGEAMAVVAPAQLEPLETASQFIVTSGGAEANVATYLAQLGHEAAWVSRLGSDPLGRRVFQDIASFGVDVSLVEFDESAPTGVYFKDPASQTRSVYYYRTGSAASKIGPEFAQRIWEMGPQILHLSGITPAISASAAELSRVLFDEAASRGVLRSFDVNYRTALWVPKQAASELSWFIRHSDICFMGLDEAESLWGEAQAHRLREFFPEPATLVVKDHSGALSFHGEDCFSAAAPLRQVKEPVGAGDAFAAGWLAGALRRMDQQDCLRLGHVLAGFALGSMADHATIPTWEELQVLLEAEYSENSD